MNPHVISWMDVQIITPDYDPDDQQFRRRFLAEGDSWFSLRGIPTSNLVVCLDLPYPAVVVSCAQPGDTIRRMGEMAKNNGFKRMTDSKLGYRWDAILLSGGGNDLIDAAGRIIQKLTVGQASKDPAAYCDLVVLKNTLDTVVEGYKGIAARRDRKSSSCPRCPMVAHTYDWTTPRDAPARFFGLKLKGPWLYKALTKAEVPQPMWIPVADYLIDSLGTAISELTQSIENFSVAQTCGKLKRADIGSRLISNDWADEIHPTMGGYMELAKQVTAQLPQT